MITQLSKIVFADSVNSIVLFLLIALTFQLNAQTIPLTGTGSACNVCVPPGWSMTFGTIDIANKTGWAGKPNYPWNGVVTNPPNGDTTWVEGVTNETASTTATGLITGTDYDLNFYMAEFRCGANGIPDHNFDGIFGIFDCNTNLLMSAFAFTGGSTNSWQAQTLNFTATASTQSFCFRYLINHGANGNFWNLSIDGIGENCVFNIALNPKDVACKGGSSGRITALITNGTHPSTYQWSNGSTTPFATGLTAGTYTITITDANGCQKTDQATVNEPSAIQTIVNSTLIPCTGGTATATITPTGGTPGYTFDWSANANGQSTATATGLMAGTYYVTVTDSTQCVGLDTIIILPNSPITLTIAGKNVSCHGKQDGTAAASIAGGTPPFQYQWSTNANGQTANTANGLGAGTYTVTTTDALGCTAVETVTITEPVRVSVDFDVVNVGCDSVNDGTTTAINVDGIPPITYQWDANAGNQNTPTAGNLATGLYRVTLTDANGCAIVAGTTVNAKDCAEPCETNPCVEAVLNNIDICTALANDPTDPLSTLDCDGDGVTNADECVDGTDPLDPCDYEDTSITLPVTADQTDCPPPCPDLTPIMTILPGNIAGMSAVEVAIQVTELDSVATNGSVVIVRVPSDPRLVFVWDIGLTVAALTPVQNVDWNYLGDNGFVHTWTYNGSGLIIDAKGVSALGFQSFYDPQATDGQTTLTATVLPFSGGECNVLNNTDSERLVYFK